MNKLKRDQMPKLIEIRHLENRLHAEAHNSDTPAAKERLFAIEERLKEQRVLLEREEVTVNDLEVLATRLFELAKKMAKTDYSHELFDIEHRLTVHIHELRGEQEIKRKEADDDAL